MPGLLVEQPEETIHRRGKELTETAISNNRSHVFNFIYEFTSGFTIELPQGLEFGHTGSNLRQSIENQSKAKEQMEGRW